jgi:hypothetical protein
LIGHVPNILYVQFNLLSMEINEITGIELLLKFCIIICNGEDRINKHYHSMPGRSHNLPVRVIQKVSPRCYIT